MNKPTQPATPAPVELPTERADPFDPPPALGELREQEPLCPMRFPDDHVGWLASSHELARSVLGDARFSMRPARMPVGDAAEHKKVREYREANMPELEEGCLLALDPPKHTRIRRALAGFFTVQRVGEHREKIERIVAERLDAMEAAGPPVDFVSEFALPVPSIAICAVLGVPPEFRHKFEHPAEVAQDLSTDASDRLGAMRELLDFAHTVVEEKRERPADDLISQLVETGELGEDELAGIADVLFDAGHETTASMLSFGTMSLLQDRSRWEYLRAHPEAIPNAVEELLRYLTVFQLGSFARTATEDVELDGREIKQGETVVVSLAAANRDPEKYPDPDGLDICRDASRHVAFGHGRHICLGQHFARLELQVSFAALIERFPELRLAEPAEGIPMSGEQHMVYGAKRLLVEW